MLRLSRDQRERFRRAYLPMTYFITFTCYGRHLHGHDSGSVDRSHRLFGSRLLEADSQRMSRAHRRMKQVPYGLDEIRREVVLQAIVQRCRERGWNLWAAHVRSSHVHLIVAAEVRPERIMNDVKSVASRLLNWAQLDPPACKRWARHGSTRWLWTREEIRAAIRYVIEQQGPPMATFERIEQ